MQVRVPPGADREARIEAAFDAACSAGGEDFEIVEDSEIVEVRSSIYLSFPVTLPLLPFRCRLRVVHVVFYLLTDLLTGFCVY